MYNRAILMGRLTADPELKQTPNGVSVCSFRIAVDRGYTPRGGERQTDFLDIVAWRSQAEFVSKYFNKGKMILVEGSIETRQYTDKDGNNRRVFEIIADNVRFAESKSASTSSRGGNESMSFPAPNQAPAANAGVSYSSGNVDDFAELDDDGDLPF